MSTEHQQYSPQNQSDTITKYAVAHNMQIVATYEDHGRSGLNLAGRDGLSRLLRDVERGLSTFTDLLVYDVSRWGRFQDTDESAYHEYVLKRAGTDSDLLTINHEYTVSLLLSRCQETRTHSQRWRLRFDTGLAPDITIAARLSPGNQAVKDYYLLPQIDLLWKRLSLAPENGVLLDLYRFDNLNVFLNLAKRLHLEDVA
jgi:hypothetical protein